jgi:hypothetical protein
VKSVRREDLAWSMNRSICGTIHMCVARWRSTAVSARCGVKPGISTTVAPAAM